MPSPTITIRLTRDDYDRLLTCIGYAAGKSYPECPARAYRFLELADTINRNRPGWTPCILPKFHKGGKPSAA